jgi:hypothetical protein
VLNSIIVDDVLHGANLWTLSSLAYVIMTNFELICCLKKTQLRLTHHFWCHLGK